MPFRGKGLCVFSTYMELVGIRKIEHREESGGMGKTEVNATVGLFGGTDGWITLNVSVPHENRAGLVDFGTLS